MLLAFMAEARAILTRRARVTPRAPAPPESAYDFRMQEDLPRSVARRGLSLVAAAPVLPLHRLG
jgi:hypothetical protein